MKNTLIGQMVILYMDSGTEFLGKVTKLDEERVFIEHDEEYFMVYRSKISAILMNAERRTRAASPPPVEPVVTSDKETSDKEEMSPVGGGNAHSVSIPLDMLTEEAQGEFLDSDDFSVYFARPELSDRSNMTFSVSDKNDDTKE